MDVIYAGGEPSDKTHHFTDTNMNFLSALSCSVYRGPDETFLASEENCGIHTGPGSSRTHCCCRAPSAGCPGSRPRRQQLRLQTPASASPGPHSGSLNTHHPSEVTDGAEGSKVKRRASYITAEYNQTAGTRRGSAHTGRKQL